LSAGAASARTARRFIADTLQRWSCAHARDVVELLTSELVTNALLHAGTAIELRLRGDGTSVRIEVADGSSLSPTPRHYGDEAQTGRGLLLVEELATDWGVDRGDEGKVVWCEVAV
jgi:anti-sigma regulatory factor (Ser/Thr protein kinase)